MIEVEGYKAFNGEMFIKPATDAIKPFTMYGDWLYKPETKCWYGCGRSFSEKICEPKEVMK